MNIFGRLFLLFYPRIKAKHRVEDVDNIVQSMAKCKQLHKKLSLLAHPDKHFEKIELATELMNQVNANRFNYLELVKLQKRIEEELCS